MANKPIGQLPVASALQSGDLLVVEQTGAAKQLDADVLEAWLLALAAGHGGISDITYTAPTAPSLDGTVTITLADNTVETFTVKNGRGITGINWVNSGTAGDGQTHTGTISYNDGTTSTIVFQDGVKGDAGPATYTYIKWASQQPTQDADMGDVPDDWLGIYVGSSSTAPTAYTSYAWYEIKGTKGDDGDPITSVTRTSGDGSPGTDDTYTVYVNSTSVGTFIVHNGTDGLGSVNSVNGIGADAENNVTLTAFDVGAPAVPLCISTTITALPKTISDAGITATMRVIDISFGTPTAITTALTWTTAAGSLVLSGSLNGSTTADIVLCETT